jgi:hypothetical protein
MTMRSAFFLTSLLAVMIGVPQASAQEQFVYVRKESREATRQASLTASGQAVWPGDWHLIGPFDDQGIDKPHPPEREINLTARYPGKGQEAIWRVFNFPDGHVHSLKQFDQSDNCVCYLYREIDAPKPIKRRVSLGSDDSIAVWLNGEKLLSKEAARPAAADQEFVTLDLKKGTNRLLVKIGNKNGDWAFYFNPVASGRLLIQLEQRLDEDFPPIGEAASYRLQTLPLPENELLEGGGLAFRPDGKLYLGTRRGDIWLVDGALAGNLDELRFEPYARGLHEITGLTLVGDNDLYVAQRPEVTLVRDSDRDDQADEFITVCDKFGCSGNYHEYLFGPARDAQGNLFVTLNVGFGGGHQSRVPYRGFCLKISPDGQMTPWAYGLRSPNSVNFSPEGRLYYCDNQGEWVATCKLHELKQGDFCGHMASVRWWEGKQDGDEPEMTPPAVWFPYSLSRSASEPVWDTTGGKFGPFAGQCFVGELTNSLVMRVYLEEVKGRTQGACFEFRRGFACGVNRLEFAPDGSLIVAQTNRGWGSVGGQPHALQRVVYTGQTPFEIHSMNITPEGWRVRFTRPVDPARAADPTAWFLESYTYHHWQTYGSPEIERREDRIEKIDVAEDGLTAELTVPERVKGRVFHLQLKGFSAADGAPLLHGDAWYTMNEIPD